MKLDRRKLKQDEFAIPEKRAYPIPDRLHARLALDDANRDGNARTRARVRRAVSEKFPELAVDAAHDHLREASDRRVSERHRQR
jgi:hypothetical protein